MRGESDSSVSKSPSKFVDSLTQILKTKADLRQSVWEARQHFSHREIREYVESVLREIESDKL